MTVITATVAEHYRRAYADPRCPEPVRQLLAQLAPKGAGEVLALKDWHDVHVPVHARGDAPRPPPVLVEGIPPSPASRAVGASPALAAAYGAASPADAVRAEADPTGRDQHAPGAKLDAGKVMPWLCISGFAHALAAVAHVTTKGALKYTPNGWVTVPDGGQRYMEAFARHLLALGRGEEVDTDTGCLHKAQMIWNLLASLELELRRENGHLASTPKGT